MSFSQVVRDIWVLLDAELTFSHHIDQTCLSCCHQLRQMRVLARSLTFNAAVSLVYAFVFSRLDFCSSIFADVPGFRMEKLRRVHRADARFVFGFKSLTKNQFNRHAFKLIISNLFLMCNLCELINILPAYRCTLVDLLLNYILASSHKCSFQDHYYSVENIRLFQMYIHRYLKLNCKNKQLSGPSKDISARCVFSFLFIEILRLPPNLPSHDSLSSDKLYPEKHSHE